MLPMSDRGEYTIYVLRPEHSGGLCGIVLPCLDYSERGRVGYFYSFVGKEQTVNVVSQHEKITREKALEIAARYVSGQSYITRVEFPQPNEDLKRIIQQENRRKYKGYKGKHYAR